MHNTVTETKTTTETKSASISQVPDYLELISNLRQAQTLLKKNLEQMMKLGLDNDSVQNFMLANITLDITKYTALVEELKKENSIYYAIRTIPDDSKYSSRIVGYFSSLENVQKIYVKDIPKYRGFNGKYIIEVKIDPSEVDFRLLDRTPANYP